MGVEGRCAAVAGTAARLGVSILGPPSSAKASDVALCSTPRRLRSGVASRTGAGGVVLDGGVDAAT